MNFGWKVLPALIVLGQAGDLTAQDLPMGPLGGTMALSPGKGTLTVTSLVAGAPGEVAGLQAGDIIHGVEGFALAPTSPEENDGYQGAVHQFAMAVESALSTDTLLDLDVIRSGTGGLSLTADLDDRGGLGVTWPAASTRGSEIYEYCCTQIHAAVQASASDDFAYNTGWFGMILLANDNWNATSGAKPYRNSINQLRARCESYLNGRVLEPEEPYYYDGSDVVPTAGYVSPGLENWDVCSSAAFLACYRMKTGDTSVDAALDRAATAIGHRVQTWYQYDDPGLPHVLGGTLGRMGHGGVAGDYSHYDGIGALNIVNAHALVALGLLKQAGVDMGVNLGLSPNSKSYDAAQLAPTLEEKFTYCWASMKHATNQTAGGDLGNVGYVSRQSGWDSAGRTPGAVAGWSLYGLAGSADDNAKLAQQKDYIARRWYRQLHCHAYTLGGSVLSQLAMPFLQDRGERYFQENTRMFAALATQPDGSVVYFPGRLNNGGDGYLNYTRVSWINAAMPVAVASGNLPGFPAREAGRVFVWMKSPVNLWTSQDARELSVLPGLTHSLDLEIQDATGSVLGNGTFVATWSKVTGPGTVAFTNADGASVDATFSQAGDYRLRLEVSSGGYVVQENYDLTITTTGGQGGLAPFVLTEPAGGTFNQGNSLVMSVDAQGTEPLVYEWKKDGETVSGPSTSDTFEIESISAGSGGDYECVVTNAYGTVTSATATVVVEGVGEFKPGGLWQDVFYGTGGGTISWLQGLPAYPSQPDASGVLPNGESSDNFGSNYGQRWSGWITPPEDGSFRFYIASDDESELWLSTDATRANRVRIAQIKGGWADPRGWFKFSSQTSAPVSLTGGQRYYLEVLHAEGGGGDNCAITWNWQSPGTWSTPTTGSTPLPGAILEYQVGGTSDDHATPPDNYPPQADDLDFLVYGGSELPVTLTGSDFEGAPLTFDLLTPPGKGSLTGTEPALIYIPFGGASGADSFTYRVSDGSHDSEVATVSLILVPEAAGDQLVWEGLTDDSWANAANWLANRTPLASDVVIFDSRSLANFDNLTDSNMMVNRLVVGDVISPVSISGSPLTVSSGIEMGAADFDLALHADVALGAGQSWNVKAGRELLMAGNLTGSAELIKTGPGILRIAAVSSRTGVLRVDGGTVELDGGGWFLGHVGGTGTVVVNDGGIVINRQTHAFGNGNNPSRDLIVNEGGRFQVASETYIDNIDLTSASLENAPGVSGQEVRAASGGSTVTVAAHANPSLISCAYNCVGPAIFNVADGASPSDLLLSGELRGSASFQKTGPGRLTLAASNPHSGGLAINAGEVSLTGSLEPSDSVSIAAGGSLLGTGTAGGAVSQSGVLEPGVDGTAVLTLGSLSQSATAITRIDLGGPAVGAQHDQIAVTGAAGLAGTLEVSLLPGFDPQAGDSFTLLTAAPVTGAFSTVNLPSLPADREWRLEIGALGVVLFVDDVPTPFENWRVAEFGSDSEDDLISGLAADPDGDGIVNLMEYALGLNPNSRNTGADLPGMAKNGTDLVFAYRRNPVASDLVYQVVESDDMGQTDPWGPAVLTSNAQIGTSGGIEIWEAGFDVGNPPTRFFALEVSLQP